MILLSCGPKLEGHSGSSRMDFGFVEGAQFWLHCGIEAVLFRAVSRGSELPVTGGIQVAIDFSKGRLSGAVNNWKEE